MKRLTAGKIGGHEISSGEVQRNRVLVVDDHQNVRNAITEVLREAGLEVESCGGGPQALLAAQGKVFQCVVSDLQMPGMDGIELMKEFSARKHPARFVMITAHASVCTAVEAMRLGAFDYIEKPCDLENLERLVFRAIRHSRSDAEPGDSPHLRNPSPAIGKNPQRNENGNGEPANSLSVPIMIGSSEVMRNLRKRIEQVAQHGETVLITGENGTGKEIVAKMIHALSPRRDHPWITLNCPALSPQLMESELFGHKKGAFTGAEQDRIGRFEAAGSGTILLDEITEIDLHLQPKLLRVLQERSFERVGSSETLPSHARVLATTNRDLSREIGGGRFREDLYYRLAVLPISVPPLRERKEDIAELFEEFLRRTTDRLGIEGPEWEPGVFELLHEYHWPGNVRQLENIATRMGVFGERERVRVEDVRRWLSLENGESPEQVKIETNFSIVPSCESISWNEWTGSFSELQEENPQTAPQSELPPESRYFSGRFPVGMSLEEMEREMIEATLEHFEGHRGKTAQSLGIGVRTLTGKLRQYGYAPREKFRR